jgi:hypothetical protein
MFLHEAKSSGVPDACKQEEAATPQATATEPSTTNSIAIE